MVDYPGTHPNHLTYAQLEGLWIKAGGPRNVAAIAAAIAEAESGGDANQYNPTDNGGTQTSWGLWQVSHGDHSPYPNWNDPATNAKYAVAKYRGAGNAFSPWGTYDSGAYRAFLSGSTTPDPNAPGAAGGVPGTGATLTAAGASPNCLLATPNFNVLGQLPIVGGLFGGPVTACILTKSGARFFAGIGMMAGATVVGLAGAIVLASYGMGHTKAGQAVTQTAETFTPAGRAAGAVASTAAGAAAPARGRHSAAGAAAPPPAGGRHRARP
jgi:hypothetical protein